MSTTNLILDTDSYKASHYLQYPPGATHISCYIESRGGDFEQTLFFGLQLFLKKTLSKPITQADIDQAESFFKAHGLPFYLEGWQHILDAHNGYLPIHIEAIAEGTCLPTSHVMLQITNTDPACFWLPTYLETALLRAVWYPTTVATISWHAKKIISRYLEKTADDLSTLPFQLHDFGARGVSSEESAAIGSLAHLVNFQGTDTISGVLAGQHYYDCPMAGYSIPAAEHSTIISWGRDHEADAYEHCMNQFLNKDTAFAIVSDSYDLWNAIETIWGGNLFDAVKNNPGRLIIRPDSGDPTCIPSKLIEMLMDRFGYTTNTKGYRELPENLRVIQGDGISLESMDECLKNMEEKKLSASNICFGMGGALLQKCHRDTLSFAMKANAICQNGQWQPICKEPITDSHKKSKPGRLALIRDDDGNYHTIQKDELTQKNELQTVFLNGEIKHETNLERVRELASLEGA